jgi:hypothetical protein
VTQFPACSVCREFVMQVVRAGQFAPARDAIAGLLHTQGCFSAELEKLVNASHVLLSGWWALVKDVKGSSLVHCLQRTGLAGRGGEIQPCRKDDGKSSPSTIWAS